MLLIFFIDSNFLKRFCIIKFPPFLSSEILKQNYTRCTVNGKSSFPTISFESGIDLYSLLFDSCCFKEDSISSKSTFAYIKSAFLVLFQTAFGACILVELFCLCSTRGRVYLLLCSKSLRATKKTKQSGIDQRIVECYKREKSVTQA